MIRFIKHKLCKWGAHSFKVKRHHEDVGFGLKAPTGEVQCLWCSVIFPAYGDVNSLKYIADVKAQHHYMRELAQDKRKQSIMR